MAFTDQLPVIGLMHRCNKLSYRKENVRLLCGPVLVKYSFMRIFCPELYRSIFNHCNVIGLLIYAIR